jgi:alkanesulfonate monooxygenase SsuD/methylene tetrahydromethanopterin reductase-like flavin-dependent oxidoreductase (luciferase family)
VIFIFIGCVIKKLQCNCVLDNTFFSWKSLNKLHRIPGFYIEDKLLLMYENGITLPNVGPQATRENIFQLATQAEKEGFDSLWTIRRILWPLKPQSAYEVSPDGTLPIEYQNVLDALDVLAYVAANTNKIALGTHVKDMFFFTPIMLAKRFIKLDVLSQGKAISGLGLG